MITVHCNQVTFFAEGNDYDWQIMSDGTWEADTFALLDRFLRPGDTMLDMGAWIGPVSLYCAAKVKKCYAFEPDPVAYKQLVHNISLNPGFEKKINVMHMAVTPDGKDVRLYARFSHGDSGSSLLKRVKSVNSYVDVKSVTFDQFLAQHPNERFDFIKMDVEGSEFKLLPLMRAYLEQQRPTLLISFHHAILCENYELLYFPWGILRRVYRKIDPQKKWIRSRATTQLRSLLESLSFYTMLDSHQKTFDVQQASDEALEQLDMLLLTAHR